MLATLHDTLNANGKSLLHRKKREPKFTFLIVHHAGRIRFFFEIEGQERSFFESQLYAHYPDIEIRE